MVMGMVVMVNPILYLEQLLFMVVVVVVRFMIIPTQSRLQVDKVVEVILVLKMLAPTILEMVELILEVVVVVQNEVPLEMPKVEMVVQE